MTDRRRGGGEGAERGRLSERKGYIMYDSLFT